MSKLISIVAPIRDENLETYHLDFSLKTRANVELTLYTLKDFFENKYRIGGGPGNAAAKPVKVPSGGYYLTSLLRTAGYQTDLYNYLDEKVLEKIQNSSPFAVCFSTTMICKSQTYRSFIKRLQDKLPGVPLIAGGVFLWKSYKYYSGTGGNDPWLLDFDLTESGSYAPYNIISPHGTASLLAVLKELEKGSKASFDHIPNLFYQNDSRMVFTERRNETVDINNDYTNWSLIDTLPFSIPIRTSVGCPFECRFCDFSTVYPNLVIRSPESLGRELKEIKKTIKARSDRGSHFMEFTDDNVFLSSKRIKEVCKTIIKNTDYPWFGMVRADHVTKDNIRLITDSRLTAVHIGLESGDESILQAMNKRLDLTKTREGIRLIDKQGIRIGLTMVSGFPGENSRTIENTAAYLNSLDVSLVHYVLFPLFVFPLSPLSTEAMRQKYGLTGLYDKWSHATADADSVYELAHELVKKVEKVPYYYVKEKVVYNQKTFTEDQRKQLYALRHRLYLAIENRQPREQVVELFKQIGTAMGYDTDSCNAAVVDKIL